MRTENVFAGVAAFMVATLSLVAYVLFVNTMFGPPVSPMRHIIAFIYGYFVVGPVFMKTYRYFRVEE